MGRLCHKCEKGVGDWCIACNAVTADDIAIRKKPHLPSEELAVAPTPDDSQAEDDMPADILDRLKLAIYAITELSPIDALLLHHIAKGGTPTNFDASVQAVVQSLRDCGGKLRRATVHARWKRIINRFAPFASLAGWQSGHAGGGRKPSSKWEQADLFPPYQVLPADSGTVQGGEVREKNRDLFCGDHGGKSWK